jgi:hypothetical protein
MSDLLDRNLTISRFDLLAGTGEAHLEGEMIVGRFAKTPLAITSAARFCEKFANSSETPTQILRFTKKYAPLTDYAKPDEPFRFELCEWRAVRGNFRKSWETVVKFYADSDKDEKSWHIPKGSHLLFSSRGNALQLERFEDLINLCFGGLPWERVRICPAPGCEKPYFVADHLKQRYCGSKVCYEWGQRKLKLEYWNRNKGRFLAQRKA